MQSTESEHQDSNPTNPKYHRVKIPLEPITLSTWYEMKREQQSLPALSEANQLSCAFCLEPFESTTTYAKCLDCNQSEVLICIECLRMGVESHPHKRGHRYSLHDSIGPSFFDEEQPRSSWGAQEDLQLLNSLIRAHLDQWSELSKDFGRKKSLTEALERLDQFLRGEIGHCVLKDLSRGNVHTWGNVNAEDDEGTEIWPQIIQSNSHTNINGELKDEDIKPDETYSADEFFGQAGASTSSHFRSRRTAYFDEEEESDDSDSAISKPQCSNLAEIGERRMSTRSVGESSSSTENRRATRKEQLLVAAKNAAVAEAFRGQRKTSLELSEAINLEGKNSTAKKGKKNVSKSELFDNEDKLAELYKSASGNPHFFNAKVPLMDAQTAAKFDEEDLQLLTYLPFRDEFEHEYKNDAEQLISRIVFPRDGAESEVDRFLNEVIYARFNRYNRLMRMRATKKAIIREHNMLNEFLNIVKSNLSEKGKYTIFEDRYFNTKSKEDYFRPVFTQLRQVADRETVNRLAKNIGAMETLKDQINELKQMQKKGITKLKGRLRVDGTPVQWSKKRKAKKSENIEQRKARLRWERIKRWTKRSHLHQSADGDVGEE